MFAMVEEDVVGNAIHTNPRNVFLLFGELRHLLYRRAAGLDGTVAVHANGSCGDAHEITGIRISVAVFALGSSGDVHLVAIWNRLCGTCILLCPRACRDSKRRDE